MHEKMARVRAARRPPGVIRMTVSKAALCRPGYLDGLDGRVGTARRFRALVIEFSKAIPKALRGAATTALIRRAAAASVASELFEAKIAKGETVNWDLFLRTSGLAQRSLTKLVQMGGRDFAIPTAARSKPDGPDLLARYLEDRRATQKPASPNTRCHKGLDDAEKAVRGA